MEEYKLYYFNVSGIAEPIRYILNYCGIKFEDIRFKDYEEWKNEYKSGMPMEQVPILEIDGEKYHQHKSICRYIAKENNLCGVTPKQSLVIDSIVDDIDDVRLVIGNYYKEEDPAFKARLKEKSLEGLQFSLNKFESQVTKNNGYFFENGITWADIYYAAVCEIMSHIMERDINENYPNLKKLVTNIRNNDRIKTYIEERPNALF